MLQSNGIDMIVTDIYVHTVGISSDSFGPSVGNNDDHLMQIFMCCRYPQMACCHMAACHRTAHYQLQIKILLSPFSNCPCGELVLMSDLGV